jgi:hypothetical protein
MATAVQTGKTGESEGDWVFKNEAATFLGVNIRAVERLSRQGIIQRKYLPRRANERQARVIFSQADLNAYRAKGEGPARDPVSKQPNALPQAGSTALVTTAQADFFTGLAAHLAKLSAAFPPPRKEWPLWLSFDEAIEYSGMRPAKLEEEIRAGTIVADGRGRGTWRICRASLDEYGKAGA